MGDNYPFFLSGLPGQVSASWLDAIAGGKQTMQLAGAIPETKPLPTTVSYQLTDVPDGTNPSVVVHDGRLLVCVRQPNANVIGELAGRKVLTSRTVSGIPLSPREFNPWRLYSLAGYLGAVACVADYSIKGTPHAQVGLVTLVGSAETGWNASGLTVLSSTRYEKNWMPCVDDDRLRLVYAAHPLTVLDTPYTVTDNLPLGGTLRGSSQLVAYKGGWLGVVHQTHLTPAGGVYLHRFIHCNKELTSVTVGRPWHLQRQGVEIVAGLAFWQDKFILSYGMDDMASTRAAWIAGVSPTIVDEMLQEG